MRRLPFLVAGFCLALGLAAQADSPSPLNLRILDFCRHSIGRKVGTGECADLAYRAMLSAGAESPDNYKDDPKPGDYVWGKLVYGHQIKAGDHFEKGERTDVQPGDIIQMRDVIIEHEESTEDTITKETVDADHHTAVVESVTGDGLTYHIIEQNANDIPTVSSGTLHVEDMKRGYILIYRAVPDSGDDGAMRRDSRMGDARASTWRKAALGPKP